MHAYMVDLFLALCRFTTLISILAGPIFSFTNSE